MALRLPPHRKNRIAMRPPDVPTLNAVTEPIPGINVEGVTGWFAEHEPAASPPLQFEGITGGHSNLTYRVTDAGGRRYVLRRPPLGELLQSAHDMGREYRVMHAMTPTAVPVPDLVGLCTDEAVNGVPFYVMHFTEGLVLRNPAEVEKVPDAVRAAAADALIDGLVALHDVEPDAVGLGELGRKEGYVERLLRRWSRQWESQRTRELPLASEVAERLAKGIPDQGPARVVHGDYRLDNAIVDPATGSLQAVLDWELCTLGDPLADVGMLLVYWTEPTDAFSPLLGAPTACPGFPGRDHVAERYARQSGRDLAEIDFYVALGWWKLAMVLEGVYARYASGAYGDTEAEWRRFESVIPQLVEAADEAARRAGR
jgi:aminoglycoside phosphotransferase (APT) family kinase protein